MWLIPRIKKPRYEFALISHLEENVNRKLQEAYDEGWEVAGSASIYNCMQGRHWIQIPVKRILK
ncbi:MAG: hypothetical protein AAF620_15330 [Bacteroidota bacterium]